MYLAYARLRQPELFRNLPEFFVFEVIVFYHSSLLLGQLRDILAHVFGEFLLFYRLHRGFRVYVGDGLRDRRRVSVVTFGRVV